MALESFDNRINVAHLSLDQPEQQKQRLFDPQEFIPGSVWEGWEEAAHRLAVETHGPYVLSQLADDVVNIYLLDPERARKLNLEETVWRKLKQGAEQAELSQRDAAVNIAAAAKVLFPGRYRANPLLSKEKVDNLKLAIHAFGQTDEYHELAHMLLNYRLVGPTDVEFTFHEEFLIPIQVALSGPKNDSDWLKAAFSLRMLFPEEFEKMKLTEEDWAELKKMLNRQDQPDPYTARARELQFIAAKEVRFTDDGIAFTKPEPQPVKDYTKREPSLPEQKNF
jgi:hypothetical protein